jgi:hypothetical protein
LVRLIINPSRPNTPKAHWFLVCYPGTHLAHTWTSPKVTHIGREADGRAQAKLRRPLGVRRNAPRAWTCESCRVTTRMA